MWHSPLTLQFLRQKEQQYKVWDFMYQDDQVQEVKHALQSTKTWWTAGRIRGYCLDTEFQSHNHSAGISACHCEDTLKNLFCMCERCMEKNVDCSCAFKAKAGILQKESVSKWCNDAARGMVWIVHKAQAPSSQVICVFVQGKLVCSLANPLKHQQLLAGESNADRLDGDFANNHLWTPIVMVVCVDDEISNNLMSFLWFYQGHKPKNSVQNDEN